MAENISSEIEPGLYLIGMGPGRLELMTEEALFYATQCTQRYYEAYTALWQDHELMRLEQRVGPLERVMRPFIEHPEELLERASQDAVAVMVVGDPLQATTHIDLQLRAEQNGVKCHVLNGLSVTGLASGLTGLSNYKFGRQTTLTYPHGSWIATSPLEVIAFNRSHGFHTLVLLDLDPTGEGIGQQRPMQPNDAFESLMLMREKMNHNEMGDQLDDLESWRVLLCSDLGCSDQRITTTTIHRLSQLEGGRLNTLLIPGALSDIEEVAISRWIEEEKT